MSFGVVLIKTPDKASFLTLNCTHVKGQYWIYEGLDELLDDELTKYSLLAHGVAPSLGGLTESELVEGCLNWFNVDVEK